MGVIKHDIVHGTTKVGCPHRDAIACNKRPLLSNLFLSLGSWSMQICNQRIPFPLIHSPACYFRRDIIKILAVYYKAEENTPTTGK